MSPPPRPRIPTGVWGLGFVSLLMDTSSEMIHGLLPAFLVSGLGASVLAVGVIEGVAELIAPCAKMASGALSDRWGRRKPLVLIGYALAAASKPLFALAPTVGWIAGGRFVDRVGKGIRGAPRDALLADMTPPSIRGAAFGLRQAMDTVGAFLGPLLALALMVLFHDRIRPVFWVATVPALLAVGVLWLGVREPAEPAAAPQPAGPEAVERAPLGAAFWWVVVAGGTLSLARCSDAFLILRSRELGLGLSLLPLILVLMNVAYALSALPAGRLSDRVGRHRVLLGGVALLLLADLLLAFPSDLGSVLVGVALWGVSLGLTQAVLSAMVADAIPPERRGTAFGAFNLVSGLGLLLASVVAGALWQFRGAAAAFSISAAFAALAALGIALGASRRR